MPAFGPKLTAITATVALGRRSFTTTFTAPAETTGSRPTTFPLRFVVSGVVDLPVLADKHNNYDDDDNASGNGFAKRTCRKSSTSAPPSTTTPLPPSQSPPSPAPQSPPPSVSPPIAPTATPRGGSTSQPAQSSGSTSTASSTTLTGGQSSLDTKSPSASEGETATGSNAASSMPSPPPSTSVAISSYSGGSDANRTPVPKLAQSSSASPASGLSAGSAIGIALGVFAAAVLLVAVTVFLFLFLRKRKRRRKRGSAGSTAKWPLTSSEGSQSRPLTSTLSWLGTLPIASDYVSSEYMYGYTASAHTREHQFYDPGTEKGGARRSRAPSPNLVPVVGTLAQEPRPQEGIARMSVPVARDHSASTLPLHSNLAAPGTGDGLGVREMDGARRQGPRDPFADPQESEVKWNSKATSSVEVESMEAL